MSDLMNVTVAGGKYTFIMRADYSTTALRYGEPWPAFEHTSPDNLHSALAAEVEGLRSELARAKDDLASAQSTIAAFAFPKTKTVKKHQNPRQRRNELVGGGHFVFCRGGRTGRIKTGAILAGKIPFEHPTLESATAEAIRLSEMHGRSFIVLSQIVVVHQEAGGAA